MRRPTVLQINAVVLAVGLTGSYVWFRAAQARERRNAAAAAAAAPGAAPATSATTLMPGSKFGAVGYENPYPDSNAIGSGFKLNNSISADFAVSADTKVGIINLIPDSRPTAT
jgi:hypothetical protein